MAFSPLYSGPGGFRVAPETTNPLRGVRLRLCALHFGIPVEPKAEPKAEKGHHPSRIDAIFDALTVEILKEAFVILIPDSNNQDSTSKPFLARTTATGQLVSIAEKDLGGAPPSSPANDVFLEPRRTYRYFWTRSGPLCRKIWKLVKDNLATALADNPFYLLRTEDQGPAPNFGGLGLKERHHGKMGLLFSPAEGTAQGHGAPTTSYKISTSRLLRGEQISKFNPKGGATDSNASYAIARTDSIAALFLTDVLTALATDIMAKTADARAVLESVRDIAVKATSDEQVGQLEEELMRGELFGHYFCRGDWHKAYYPYANRCAKKGVPRDLFRDAVAVSTRSKEWEAAAAEIAGRYSIPHPDYPGLRKWDHINVYDWKVEVEPVLKIFDFYTFGLANLIGNSDGGWNNQSTGANLAAERHLRLLKQLCGNLLRKQASYMRFLQELDAQFADDFEQRRQIHTRFLGLSLASEYRWWEEFDSGFFARIKPYCDWLAADASKVAELLTDFFGEPGKIVEFNHLLQENVEEFEHMFRKMNDFDNHFGGKKTKRKLLDGTKFEVDFEHNRLKIKPPGEEVKEIGPLYFLVKTTEERTLVREEQQLSRKNPNRRGSRVRIKRVETKTRTAMAVVPDLPFKQLHRMPLWLGAFGDALALAVAISQLGKELEEKEKITVVAKLAGATLTSIDSVSTAITFTFTCRTGIPWLLKYASPASKLIEAYYNVKEGVILMFFSDESEVMSALEKGDKVDAVLLMVKGVVLVSSVVPGVVALGAALIGLAAMGSVIPVLGAGLAIAAIIVTGIEMIRYLRNGPENAMDPVAEKLKKAIKEELREHSPSRTAVLLSSLTSHSRQLLDATGA